MLIQKVLKTNYILEVLHVKNEHIYTCVSSMNALSAQRCLFKKSTQCFSKAGTAYFFAVYKVVMTVSGPIWTSSEYRNFSKAKKDAGSTSGNGISSSLVAKVELNMASKTAEPTDNTNLCAGILCCKLSRPKKNKN